MVKCFPDTRFHCLGMRLDQKEQAEKKQNELSDGFVLHESKNSVTVIAKNPAWWWYRQKPGNRCS